jgi:hypothetical protein
MRITLTIGELKSLANRESWSTEEAAILAGSVSPLISLLEDYESYLVNLAKELISEDCELELRDKECPHRRRGHLCASEKDQIDCWVQYAKRRKEGSNE